MLCCGSWYCHYQSENSGSLDFFQMEGEKKKKFSYKIQTTKVIITHDCILFSQCNWFLEVCISLLFIPSGLLTVIL